MTAALDQQLLDIIDQYAPSYYRSTWNMNMEQFKAWIATIAWGEGGKGGFGAESQGAPGSDLFYHKDYPSFTFSTGIGPFQLDRGGYDGWGTWSTIEKLDPAQAVQSAMRQHYQQFPSAGATLQTFADTSAWYAVRPGNVETRWSQSTGTTWSQYSGGNVSLAWSTIESQLAANASDPAVYPYAQNVVSIGSKTWNIPASAGLCTESGKPIVFTGEHDTWHITARTWSGTKLFQYYYTYDTSSDIEIWVHDDESLRYIFEREANGPCPERYLTAPGDTLASAALILSQSLPSLSINDVSLTEGNYGTKTFRFTVSMSGTNTSGASVSYATGNGSATADSDYASASGTLTWAAGDTSSKTINVTVYRDTTSEPDETFHVNLSGASGATISDGQGIGTIQNDDSQSQPSLSINDVTISEGDSGTKTFAFTVSMSGSNPSGASVSYATANDSATAGSDYVATDGALTWAAGDTSAKTVNVTVNGDTTVESDETFHVNLSSPTNAILGDSQAVGTILNDDAAFSIADATVTEGNSGKKSLPFAVSRSGSNTAGASVNYAVYPGTATADVDFKQSHGVLYFAPGQSQNTIRVVVIGDKLHEDNETFTVVLTDPATSETVGQATGTILNDDAQPKVSINNVTVKPEGNLGATTNAAFTVTLSASSGRPTTVYYATANGTASDASDYQAAAPNASVTIPAYQTKWTISVPVNGDAMDEANETFKVNVTRADGAAISRSSGTATIVDDDDAPSVMIGDATLVTDTLGTRAEFLVTLSDPSGLTAKVKYATANGTAKSGKDFKSTSGTLVFAAGQLQQTISVPLVGELSLKTGKTFVVKLSSPKAAKLVSPGKGTCTIQVVSPSSPSWLEALTSARKPASRTTTSQYGPAVDEAIRLLMLTSTP